MTEKKKRIPTQKQLEALARGRAKRTEKLKNRKPRGRPPKAKK